MRLDKTVENNEARIWEQIASGATAAGDPATVEATLTKAREMKGLAADEIAVLMSITDSQQLEELFSAAQYIKEQIYGSRLVIFAPLYISNLCHNDCAYCAFRSSNKAIHRQALSSEQIADETRALVDQGHKRLLLVAGEAYPREGLDYILNAIDTIYSVRSGSGEIRRINVNIAPLEVEEFRELKARRIGTYQIFQETYHRETYAQVHPRGPKADYDWRLAAMDRAMTAGIDDVGIGVLFGLADWRFEVLAMMEHVRSLEEKFGVGPHTISIPRIEPADGSPLSTAPTRPVSDADFRKLVAILRLAVPYTGIILSTRETAYTRSQCLALGVSQISAGSRTNPGGYGDGTDEAAPQFSLGDHRSLEEVIRDVAQHGYIPSFCTGCYRLGRTGADFMDLAKPGDIRSHCGPNGLSSFLEYLIDYADAKTQAIGESCIAQALEQFEEIPRQRAEALLAKVRRGGRDLFC